MKFIPCIVSALCPLICSILLFPSLPSFQLINRSLLNHSFFIKWGLCSSLRSSQSNAFCNIFRTSEDKKKEERKETRMSRGIE